jgi:hypothetical protein
MMIAFSLALAAGAYLIAAALICAASDSASRLNG